MKNTRSEDKGKRRNTTMAAKKEAKQHQHRPSTFQSSRENEEKKKIARLDCAVDQQLL